MHLPGRKPGGEQRFNLAESPNRYGLLRFYELHAWIWKPNPSGLFADYNPRVDCLVERSAGGPGAASASAHRP